MNDSDALWKAKNALREYAGARRRLAYRLTGPGAGVRAADHFMANIPVAPSAIVSGYWPIRDEFDTMPLLRRLAAAGYRVGYARKAWGPGSVKAAGRESNPAGPERYNSLRELLDADKGSGPFCFGTTAVT